MVADGCADVAGAYALLAVGCAVAAVAWACTAAGCAAIAADCMAVALACAVAGVACAVVARACGFVVLVCARDMIACTRAAAGCLLVAVACVVVAVACALGGSCGIDDSRRLGLALRASVSTHDLDELAGQLRARGNRRMDARRERPAVGIAGASDDPRVLVVLTMKRVEVGAVEGDQRPTFRRRVDELLRVAEAAPARVHHRDDVVPQRAELRDDAVVEVLVRVELHSPVSLSARSCAISSACSSA